MPSVVREILAGSDRVEGLHGGHEALLALVAVLASEQVLLGDAAVLEHQLGVCTARRPILSSILPTLNPGVPY